MLKSKALLIELIQTLVVSAAIFLGVHAAVVPRIVEGQSMEPTLHNHENVLVERLSYWLHDPERGDVVVFKPPFGGDDYIKRVIGLPGDHVVVENGKVYINGHALQESYIADPPNYTDNRVVPKGYLYVLGDNRDNSGDSHEWGLLPRQNVVGKALFTYWPLSDLSVLHHVSYPGVH